VVVQIPSFDTARVGDGSAGKSVVDAVSGNSGGTEPAGSDPGADRPQGQRTRPKLAHALANCARNCSRLPQTVSEPGESPIAPVTAQGSPKQSVSPASLPLRP
jgi:hypothetical protein